MELLQLKYFKAVAECGKIKTAAEQLYVSSPALSASIARLENDLGVQLFERTYNRIRLNRQGEIFLNYVNQILAQLEQARRDIHQSLAAQNLQIPLAVTVSNLWSELFDAYAVACPEVALSVTTCNLTRLQQLDLLHEQMFLLADQEDLPQTRLDSVLLFVDQPYVMLPREHRLAEQAAVSLSELLEEELFLTIPGQSMNSKVRRLFADAGLQVKFAGEYSSEICGHMVSKGRGIGFTTQHSPHIHPDIRYLPLKETVRWEQRLYWHRDRALKQHALDFRDFVTAFFCDPTKLPREGAALPETK